MASAIRMAGSTFCSLMCVFFFVLPTFFCFFFVWSGRTAQKQGRTEKEGTMKRTLRDLQADDEDDIPSSLFDVRLFIQEPLPAGFMCAICHHVLDNPHTVHASDPHAFCHDCLFLAQVHKCPICRMERDPQHPALVSNPTLQLSIRNLTIRCPGGLTRGCAWTGAQMDGLAHWDQCIYRQKACASCKELVPYVQYTQHTQAVSCSLCAATGFCATSLYQHGLECPDQKVECTYCSASYVRKEEAAHMRQAWSLHLLFKMVLPTVEEDTLLDFALQHIHSVDLQRDLLTVCTSKVAHCKRIVQHERCLTWLKQCVSLHLVHRDIMGHVLQCVLFMDIPEGESGREWKLDALCWHIVRAHFLSADIVVSCLAILRKIMCYDSTSTVDSMFILSHQQLLYQVLRTHASMVSIQRHGIMIWNSMVACVPEVVTSLCRLQIPWHVMDVMGQHPHHKDLMQMGAVFLCTITNVEEVDVPAFLLHQMLSRWMTWIKLYASHAMIQHMLLGWLVHLVVADASCRHRLLAEPQVQTVLSIMRVHVTHVGIQEYGCRYLCFVSVSEYEHLRPQIWQVLNAASRHHEGLPKLHEFIGDVMCALLKTMDDTRMMMPLVVHMMDRHPTKLSVQRNSMRCIYETMLIVRATPHTLPVLMMSLQPIMSRMFLLMTLHKSRRSFLLWGWKAILMWLDAGPLVVPLSSELCDLMRIHLESNRCPDVLQVMSQVMQQFLMRVPEVTMVQAMVTTYVRTLLESAAPSTLVLGLHVLLQMSRTPAWNEVWNAQTFWCGTLLDILYEHANNEALQVVAHELLLYMPSQHVLGHIARMTLRVMHMMERFPALEKVQVLACKCLDRYVRLCHMDVLSHGLDGLLTCLLKAWSDFPQSVEITCLITELLPLMESNVTMLVEEIQKRLPTSKHRETLVSQLSSSAAMDDCESETT